MIDIRLPNITGATEREQLQQTKTYLYQLVEQLNWALNNIDTQSNTSVVAPTARSLAPVDSGSVGQSDPQATFASIKSLIIKSAEIVDAYYDEINTKLVGEYEALSDFGTYKEATEQLIKATPDGIEQTFNNIQILESTVETNKTGLEANMNNLAGAVKDSATTIGDLEKTTKERLDEVNKSASDLSGKVTGLETTIKGVQEDVVEKENALKSAIDDTNTVVKKVTGIIKSGVIGKDNNGDDVIGIMIGQTNTENDVEVYSAYASFTSNRLSFYNSSGYEVAYISNQKLYITEAEITFSSKTGGLVDTVMANGRVVTKWEGVN